jgi:hypothetical protein
MNNFLSIIFKDGSEGKLPVDNHINVKCARNAFTALQFTQNDANMIIDELLEHSLREAAAAKLRLELLSNIENQTELQEFLCCAVNECETDMPQDAFISFLREVCAAFLFRKCQEKSQHDCTSV